MPPSKQQRVEKLIDTADLLSFFLDECDTNKDIESVFAIINISATDDASDATKTFVRLRKKEKSSIRQKEELVRIIVKRVWVPT